MKDLGLSVHSRQKCSRIGLSRLQILLSNSILFFSKTCDLVFEPSFLGNDHLRAQFQGTETQVFGCSTGIIPPYFTRNLTISLQTRC
jgi:hypothetical protein